mgnify:CR=1 FL=1
MAREGVYFRNAMVTTSLCSPSRASILTGMYMHHHGVVDNNVPLNPQLASFPQYLQAAGYRTGFFGKWHMGGEIDDPQKGFDPLVVLIAIPRVGLGPDHPPDALLIQDHQLGLGDHGARDRLAVPQRGEERFTLDPELPYATDCRVMPSGRLALWIPAALGQVRVEQDCPLVELDPEEGLARLVHERYPRRSLSANAFLANPDAAALYLSNDRSLALTGPAAAETSGGIGEGVAEGMGLPAGASFQWLLLRAGRLG